MVDLLRVRRLNDRPLRSDGRYVLYWMIAARRAGWSHALDRALELGEEHDLPLLVLEPLSCSYRHASDRLHAFAVEGMRDNAAAFARAGVRHHPWVEPTPGAGRGLVEALAAQAAVVVTDDYPTFHLPRWTARLAERVDVRVEAVDGNGLLPLAATERAFPTAYAFRRFLQRALPEHLDRPPAARPFHRRRRRPPAPLPEEVGRRWPATDLDALALADLPIDHAVPPVRSVRGGSRAAEEALSDFVAERLERYGAERSDPTSDASSGLSPWLHWGHLSSHRVLAAVAGREGWAPDEVAAGSASGKREGWWGMSPPAEAFLDELVTWRELGQVFCRHVADPTAWGSLPDWARATLRAHERDPRPHMYTAEELEAAATHDALWNAAQNQLLREGRIHNYLRMVWGKKVLHWSASPEEALATLVALNDRWALDGRDPNSYSGIGWVFGRFDRAWGPEREVFGKVRYMSLDNTRRKLRVKAYVERYGDAAPALF